jgi:hypothetical protein
VNKIRIDLNQPRFQDDLLNLPVAEVSRLLSCFAKIRKLSWDELYRDRGLRWEAIESSSGPNGQKLYSLRVSQKMRAVAYRDKEWMRMISLHPDHDSAYN